MRSKFTVVLLLVFGNISLFAQPSGFSPRGVGGGGALFFPTINPANDNEFYVSCDMSELFHSTDFGNSYSQIHFSKLAVQNVSTYEFTNNPSIAYNNHNDGNNGYPVKTTDGGNTWIMLPGFDANLGRVYRMAANYNDPNQILMNYYGDIVFSDNGGTNFQLVKHAANMGAGLIMGGVFYDGNNIYIGTNEGLLVSNNGGISFATMTTTGIPAGQVIWSFAAGKAGGTTRFLCITAGSGDVYNGLMPWEYYNLAKGVFAMDNTNGTWQSKSTGINFSNDFVMYAAMARNDVSTLYLGGNDNALGAPLIYKSTDGGNSWNKVFKSANNQNIHTGWSGAGGDKQWSWGETTFGITVAPNNSGKVMFGDFGFVHVSSDGGGSWKQAYVNNSDHHAANATTPPKQYYHSIGLENTTCWQVTWQNANIMLSAYSDIGAIRSVDSGKTWGFSYSGMSVNSVYRIAKANNGNLFAGTSTIHDMYQSTRLKDAQLDANDGNGKIMYSVDNGANWNQLHSFGHPVFWVTIDPNDQNRMYASVIHYGGGSGQGGIWTTTNLGLLSSSTWTKLPNPSRTEGHPASIEVLNDGKVVCTYSARINGSGAFTGSSGVFVYDPANGQWSDVSDAGMYYWTKDIVIDPTDATQNTWYVSVFSGWGGNPNGKGGLYKTTNRGSSWTKLTGSQFDRVTSITFNPTNTNQAFLTTEMQGLWLSSNMNTNTPTWSLVASYPFRQPERVFFNPYNTNEVWVSSFGNGMKLGYMIGPNAISFIEKQAAFRIYPNPVAGTLHVSFAATDGKPRIISVWDMMGKIMDSKVITDKISSFETGRYTAGVYIVTDGQTSVSFIKE